MRSPCGGPAVVKRGQTVFSFPLPSPQGWIDSFYVVVLVFLFSLLSSACAIVCVCDAYLLLVCVKCVLILTKIAFRFSATLDLFSFCEVAATSFVGLSFRGGVSLVNEITRETKSAHRHCNNNLLYRVYDLSMPS